MPALSPDPSTPSPAPVDEPLAPRWHTAALVGVIVFVAVVGTLLTRLGGTAVPAPPAASPRLLGVYVPLLIVQWGLVVYVSRVGRPRGALSALLGQRWHSWGRAAADLGLALLGWLLLLLCELAWSRLFATAAAASVTTMLPHSWPERVAWAVVALSVGFCEEVVYRGYLQTQLTAFTGRASAGLVLQAILFGLAHAEQGPGAMVRLGAYGLAFGGLARWRRSLLPGITCHAWTDLASGLLRP